MRDSNLKAVDTAISLRFTGRQVPRTKYISENRMLKMLKLHDWLGLFGVFFFVGTMASGYYFNLTFVQLGLEDFGSRMLGLNAQVVARDMAFLALLTCLTAVSFGFWMQKQGWGRRFQLKLRLSFIVVLFQAVLTLVIPSVHSEMGFLMWLAGFSAAMGVGVPVMFSMTVDLVPVQMRGGAAALVTALAYFAAEVFSKDWHFEAFRRQSLLMMAVGVAGLGVLVFLRRSWVEQLSKQHLKMEFGRGRFVRKSVAGARCPSRRMLGLILVMFGIYFIDSLGFLRLLKTPLYMEGAWQSPELDVRLFIAGTHVAGALVAGVLYSAFQERPLFLWIFGIFALAHLQYSFHIRSGSENAILSMPMLYALAVSLYTVFNFAIWADISTPDTISLNAALGVALSGWSATFLSTGLAVYWGDRLPLDLHIRVVDSLAILFFMVVLGLVFLRSEPVLLARR